MKERKENEKHTEENRKRYNPSCASRYDGVTL